MTPIATELPEKLDSVIRVRKGKDTLAMGNITGAMVFQSMIPTVVALVFAPAAWSASSGAPIVFATVAIAFASSATIFVPMRMRGLLRGRWLLVGGAYYLAFLALVVLGIGTGSAAPARRAVRRGADGILGTVPRGVRGGGIGSAAPW